MNQRKLVRKPKYNYKYIIALK